MPVWCKKLLFPGGKRVALLSALGVAGLLLAFGSRLGNLPFACFACALTITAAWVVTKPIPAVRRRLHRISLIHRYLTGNDFKVWTGLLMSLAVNQAYAVFKQACAIWYLSFWDGVLAFCNLPLRALCFHRSISSRANAARRAGNKSFAPIRLPAPSLWYRTAPRASSPCKPYSMGAATPNPRALVFCIAAHMVLRAAMGGNICPGHRLRHEPENHRPYLRKILPGRRLPIPNFS